MKKRNSKIDSEADHVDSGRRGFLRAAGGAGALGALALAAGEAQVADVAAVPAAAAEARPRGYHETEHIRQYYRTARYW